MFSMRKRLISLGVLLAMFAGPHTAAMFSVPAAASEIKLIVNRVPITTYDIQRRAAFMRLQNRKGNLNALAEQEMVDQALRLAEAARLNIRVSEDQVADAYKRFADFEQDVGQAARRHHGAVGGDEVALPGVHPVADELEPGAECTRTRRNGG